MANTINLIEKYVPLLDEVYKTNALTANLDAPADLIRETADAKTILLADMVLQGLGDYDRANGFVNGDATLTWNSHTFSMDRGRSFQIDSMDNQETADVAYGRLAGEFIRSYVVPEVDAYRFATMAGSAGTTVNADLTATTVVQAIDTAGAQMDDAEVPTEGRILYVSPQTYNAIKQSDLFERNVETVGQDGISRTFSMFDGMRVVKVPKTRFQTGFTFNDGTTAGQEAGGFVQAVGQRAINFMIVHPSAVASITKHAKPRVFSPDVNQEADAWKYDYRLYHDLFVLGNKVDGIYVHAVATANV
jgi:hypothetical protein